MNRLTEIFLCATCKGNGRANARAGIGIYFGEGDPRNAAGYLDGVTNNQAILFASIEALKRSMKSPTVSIYCNSKYVIDGINNWITGWKSNNWKNAKNQPIANVELWITFDCLYTSRTGVSLKYVDSKSSQYKKASELAHLAENNEVPISYVNIPPSEITQSFEKVAAINSESRQGTNAPIIPEPTLDTALKSTASNQEVIKVYTDGSCRGNGKTGARAGIGIFVADGDSRNVSERYLDGPTNNRAEIYAVIRALEIFKDAPNVMIYSDSQYTINGIKTWINNWKKQGWKTSNGQPVANKDLWQRFDQLYSARKDVSIEYVEAHCGIYGNEKADEFANRGAMLN
ncbi:hypothetical protein HDV04_005380 [Boothiomyces sp. JEL0838]|nr:hypothetical protein HDV04_005380 [Boothiomyces sp. JEL0838]